MNKKESQDLTNDMMLTEALLQIKTMQKLLIAKGIYTEEEFVDTMSDIAKAVAKTLLQKSNVIGNIDDLINSFNRTDKKNN